MKTQVEKIRSISPDAWTSIFFFFLFIYFFNDGVFVTLPFIVRHTSCASLTNPRLLLPSSPPRPSPPPPSPLIEILPGAQTLPILGTELREGRWVGRGWYTRTCAIVWCPVRCVCQAFNPCCGTEGQGSPRGISMTLLPETSGGGIPAPICWKRARFSVCVCVCLGILLINSCVYAICVRWRINTTIPFTVTVGESWGLSFPIHQNHHVGLDFLLGIPKY